MTNDESAHLISRLKEGDEGAATEIFDRYVVRLIGLARSRLSSKLARKVDAEDVAQSVFRSFFGRASEGEYQLRRSGDLWRLLASITMHKVLRQAEFHGAAKRSLSAEESLGAGDDSSAGRRGGISAEPSPDDAVTLQEELDLVMRELTPAHRELLAQRLQGGSIAEISQSMQVTERQVRRVLQKVRKRLEERLLDSSGANPA